MSAVQNDALRALERFADIAFQPPPRIEPDGAATDPVQIERVPAGQKRPRAESKSESDRDVCGSPAVSPVEGEASEAGKTQEARGLVARYTKEAEGLESQAKALELKGDVVVREALVKKLTSIEFTLVPYSRDSQPTRLEHVDAKGMDAMSGSAEAGGDN